MLGITLTTSPDRTTPMGPAAGRRSFFLPSALGDCAPGRVVRRAPGFVWERLMVQALGVALLCAFIAFLVIVDLSRIVRGRARIESPEET